VLVDVCAVCEGRSSYLPHQGGVWGGHPFISIAEVTLHEGRNNLHLGSRNGRAAQ
jgi:hypothetical protein